MKCAAYKSFDPLVSERSLTTFSSSSIRTEDSQFWTLSRNFATGAYPVAGEHYVVLPEWHPLALRRWLAVQAVYVEPKSLDGTSSTAVTFRLVIDGDPFYWDGAAWSAAGAGDWNTIEEVQANLSSLPVTEKRVAVSFRLYTSDSKLSPTVSRVDIAAEIVLAGHWYEFVYRGLVRKLKAVRPETDIVVLWPTTGATFDLDTLDQEDPLTIESVVEAYDHDADPDLTTDLFRSWNSGTRVVTLSESVAEGTPIILRVKIQPTVAYTTQPDYNVSAKLPAIELSEISGSMVHHSPGSRAFVNRSDLSAFRIANPRQVDFLLVIGGKAKTAREASSLVESCLALIKEDPFLNLAELDEAVDLVIQGEITMAPSFDEIGTHLAKVMVMARSVSRWKEGTLNGYSVGTFSASGTVDSTVEG